MQAEKLLSPDTYTFNRIFLGKEINPVVLNKKWKEYLEQTYTNQLTQACKATKSIAVRSTLMSRHEKDMYKDQRYYSGIKVYYLFPENDVPLNIYCRLVQDEGKVVFE
jgi:hypothetical protein